MVHPCARKMDISLRALARPVPRPMRLSIKPALGSADYLGCGFSGIAMTFERILLGHNPPRIAPQAVFDGEKHRTSRLTVHAKGANEPTTTVAWSLLLAMVFEPQSSCSGMRFLATRIGPGSR